jgi:indolepyruvate ferredoxin oxidoreductase, beta subunit
MSTASSIHPLTVLIAALGGEGGGVLMNWLVAAARAQGLPVQATSVPGVAQRTGSTSYYIEMFTTPLAAGAKLPLFALVPMPGRVDVAIASEFVEAGRLIERGFVSPQRTTLITSTSRFYTTAEKITMGDGRYDHDQVRAAGTALAQRFIALDLEALARAHGTQVSAAMFGALAGAGVLPWPRALSESIMGDAQSARANRACFAASFDAVQTPAIATVTAAVASPITPPADLGSLSDLPPSVREVAALGLARATDFQDAAYAELYLQRVLRLAKATGSTDLEQQALIEAARRLALWMAYEDVPRVADLKTRPERFDRIRAESEMREGQVLTVVEYLKPGASEIADMLPLALGQRMQKRIDAGKGFPLLGRGIHLKSTAISGYAMLRALAAFKHIRRRSRRWAEEQASIELWLNAMTHTLPRAPLFAAALAELPRVLKGYADTHQRGRRAYAEIYTKLVTPAVAAGSEVAATASLRKALAAALADPEHKALDALLAASAKRA